MHPGLDAELDERALQRQAVDDRREHAHVIRRRPIHPAMVSGQAAPDIATTDHDRRLDSERLHFLDPLGDLAHDLGRNILLRAAFAQSLPAQLEHDTFIDGRLSFALHGRQ